MTITTNDQSTAIPRLLLTPTEAAAALGIGRSKLYELLKSGEVPSITIGACRRIVASDLNDVIDEIKKAQHADAGTPVD